jgi:hypothetical protein
VSKARGCGHARGSGLAPKAWQHLRQYPSSYIFQCFKKKLWFFFDGSNNFFKKFTNDDNNNNNNSTINS